MSNCNHNSYIKRYIEETEDYRGDIIPGHWSYENVSAFEDIDLHRMKCSKCGKIEYYSGAASRHYEDGDNESNDILFN